MVIIFNVGCKVLFASNRLRIPGIGCADEGGASFAIDALRSSAHPDPFHTYITLDQETF